jgi:ABC-type transport system involved in multi-copper enzyme maturation permease subunit
MTPVLKSEFRKLLTVRSTYIITALVLILVMFVSFYAQGWRLSNASLHDPTQLSGDVFGALTTTLFGAVIAILLMTHEYRYNTITYTLTASRSRSTVLLAKIIVVSCYSLLLAALIGVLSPLMSYLGVALHGETLVPQFLNYGDLAWRSLFFGWGYGMAGLLLAVLTRNQVASIVALFVIPDLVEQLLGLLLKQNIIYLPFSSLDQVIRAGTTDSVGGQMVTLSAQRAAINYCAYLIVGWAIAWFLFLKRDAS